jgi:hypothetical protein
MINSLGVTGIKERLPRKELWKKRIGTGEE